jgi:hypothetical protein
VGVSICIDERSRWKNDNALHILAVRRMGRASEGLVGARKDEGVKGKGKVSRSRTLMYSLSVANAIIAE